MRPETKATRRLSWAMILICIASAFLMLIPVWPEKLLWLYAVGFWAPMIAAYVLYFITDSWRRKDQKTESCPDEFRRPPGAFRLGKTSATRVCGALALLALVFLLLRIAMHKPAAFVDFVAAAILFATVQLRAFLAGRNLRYARYKRILRAKRRSAKKKKKS